MEKRIVIENAVVRSADVGSRAVQVIASQGSETGPVDRMDDIVMAAGCRLNEITSRGIIVLAQHDTDSPIARATRVWRSGDRIMAHIEFPPEGTSAKSDEYLRLVKSGGIDSCSIGFIPHKSEPLGRGGGMRIVDWSLLEISFVSTPALPSAVVTAKTNKGGFVAQASARLNELLKRCGRAPAVSQSGKPMSDLQRRSWLVEQRQRQQTADLLNSPRYAHLRTEETGARARRVRSHRHITRGRT